MKILVDNGHGSDTKGKYSPMLDDYTRYYEWQHSRIIAKRIVSELKARGYDAELLTPETNDISLGERVRRANKIAKQLGNSNVMVVSIHSNAAGDKGEWTNARGWSIYTSPGKTKSDDIASCIYFATEKTLQAAEYLCTFTPLELANRQRPMRSDFSDGDPDYEAKFYILTKTTCPAVLSENLFHDNKKDVTFLMSEKGTNAIVQGHVNGILDYLDNFR